MTQGTGPEWRFGEPGGDARHALALGHRLGANASTGAISYIEDGCIVEGCTEPDLHDFVRVTLDGRSIVHLHDDEAGR